MAITIYTETKCDRCGMTAREEGSRPSKQADGFEHFYVGNARGVLCQGCTIRVRIALTPDGATYDSRRYIEPPHSPFSEDRR